MVTNESATANFIIEAEQSVKNMYLICSHPRLFGFKTMELGSESRSINLLFRAKLVGNINVKFLIRYEFDGAETIGSKYRFKRAELNLHIKDAFDFVPKFHLSKKINGQFIVQLSTYQNPFKFSNKSLDK
jgi:hypothetical protein